MENLMQKIRKESLRNCIIVTAIATVLLAAAAYFMGFKMINYYSGTKDYWESYDSFYGEDKSFGLKNMENQYVSLDMDILFGSFKEVYKNNDDTVNNRDSFYYVFPISIDEGEYMVVKTRGSNDKDIWNLAKATYEYYMEGTSDVMPSPVELKGGFEKLDEGIRQEAAEYLVNMGDIKLSDYMLTADYMGGIDTGLYLLVLIAAGIILVILLIQWISYAGGTRVKKLKKYVDGLSMGQQEELQRDYEKALMNKRGGVLYGDKFMFFPKGKYFRVAAYRDLVWMYGKNIKHRTNGIPTGTTRSIILYDKNKELYEVGNGASEKVRDELFDRIKQKQPNIFWGYNDDVDNLFRQDFSRMVSMALAGDGIAATEYYDYEEAGRREPDSRPDNYDELKYDVELTVAGPNKVKVIQIIREVTGLGLKEAKDIADGAPQLIKSGVVKEEAQTIKERLQAEGAKVTLR